jgi:hypothetical protein
MLRIIKKHRALRSAINVLLMSGVSLVVVLSAHAQVSEATLVR